MQVQLEESEHKLDAIDTVKAALGVFAPMLREARVDEVRCAEAVGDPNLLATDLADYLVNRGLPFRKAHEAVGALVRVCGDRGVGLADASAADLAAAGLEGIDVPELTALASVETKDVPGGTARARVQQQLDEIAKRVAAW
jgi:argininosuccinate lyase